MKKYKKTVNKYQLKKIKSDIPSAKLTNSLDAYEYAKQFYFDDIEIYESFFIILLNRANNVEGFVKISQGGIAGTIVDTKIICKYALDSLASGVILVHNHPSGNINPSNADYNITTKIKKALSLLDILVIEHLIITKETYYSFADNDTL